MKPVYDDRWLKFWPQVWSLIGLVTGTAIAYFWLFR